MEFKLSSRGLGRHGVVWLCVAFCSFFSAPTFADDPVKITIPNPDSPVPARKTFSAPSAEMTANLTTLWPESAPEPTVEERAAQALAAQRANAIVLVPVQTAQVPPPADERSASAANLTPNQMAQLAPAAGEPTQAPLILLPEDEEDAAKPAAKPLPPIVPLVAATPVVEPPAPVTAAPLPPPIVPLTTPPEDVAEFDRLLMPPSPEATVKSGALPPIDSAKTQAKAKTAAAPEAASSEPPSGLSQESRDILKNIPSNLDREHGNDQTVKISRTKDTDYLQSQDKHDASAKDMGITVEVKKPGIDVNYELEKAYNALMSGHSADAIEIYKTVLANDPNNKNALFGLATTYHRAGQIDLARPLYGKLLAMEPDNRDALNNFMVLLADESPQAALEELEKLAEKNPDFSPIQAQLAVIYQKLGDWDKASQKMFVAIALAPENLTYRYNLAILLDQQKKYDEAAKLYRQIIEASQRGEVIPGNLQKIQERLTFISSNRH